MKKTFGFTLIELLVTLAIAAILISIGVPSFYSLLQRLQSEAEQRDILELARLARLTAVNEAVGTVLCSTKDGTACDDNTHWKNRIVAFQDVNDNHELDSGDTVLNSTSFDDGYFSGTQEKLEFNPSGGGYMGSWTFCSEEKRAEKNKFALIVSLGGRIRIETSNTAPCS